MGIAHDIIGKRFWDPLAAIFLRLASCWAPQSPLPLYPDVSPLLDSVTFASEEGLRTEVVDGYYD